MTRRILTAIALCIAIAGTLDISDALIFYGIRGTPPAVLLQGIASALLGERALSGGLPMAFVGLGMHYCIAAAWATLFILVSTRWTALRRHALVSGPLYGVLVYLVMKYVVLPLTRLPNGGHSHFHWVPFVNAVLALVCCIGLPVALISRRVLGREAI